jgi:hypothetical protein
MVLHRKKHAI